MKGAAGTGGTAGYRGGARTLVMGPAVGTETERGDGLPAFALNGASDCETPGARMNCSRSSTLVRPLAVMRGGGGVRVGTHGTRCMHVPGNPTHIHGTL